MKMQRGRDGNGTPAGRKGTPSPGWCAPGAQSSHWVMILEMFEGGIRDGGKGNAGRQLFSLK